MENTSLIWTGHETHHIRLFAMDTTNLPVDVFRLATIRAPRKPIISQQAQRTVTYGSNSTLYQTLKAQRIGANPRATMKTTAQGYKTNADYIATIADLNTLFRGFGRVDDYLRTTRRAAVKADLVTLLESALVLGQLIGNYVGAGSYPGLKSKVWDNLMVLSIIGENVALRTEETRVLRLLGLIERLAVGDTTLNTGPGIYTAYMATVLLPGDVFPLPDLALPTEPTTQPAPSMAAQ